MSYSVFKYQNILNTEFGSQSEIIPPCKYYIKIVTKNFLNNFLIFITALGFCNGRECAHNAECVNFQCLCKRGYFGDGIRRCRST